ncbi:MAG TPA: hypothetical protein VFJ82_06935 [Longimicrobium sp.]|nr:hypothetical protein [Longimicrobium sp.]
MSIYDIHLEDDDDLRRMDEIAEAGENPAALVKIADIRPLEFARFLVETGRAASPVGLLMWGLSLARVTVSERQAKVLPDAGSAALTTTLVVSGLHSANVALRRRSWTAGLFSLLTLGGGLGYYLSRVVRPQSRTATDFPLNDKETADVEGLADMDMANLGERALAEIERGAVIMRP